MRVSTPTISWHNRERVSSLDFQPVPHPGPTPGGQTGATRLATAGDDKHVIVWEIVVDDEGKIEPRCLCDISRHHQNSVNVVRWSPDGKLLASGDTDSAVFLWHFDKDVESSAPDIFSDDAGNDRAENVENWSLSRILRGHLQDVVGLCWSPDSVHLATCSTDSTVVVFDVKKGGAKIKIMSDHKGWVNGVAWDPLNKYVVSIASDRCLRVFSAKNQRIVSKTFKATLSVEGSSTEEGKVTRLFHDDTFMSFYRRMDFSPDGELLAVPSGILEADSSSDSGKVAHCTHIFHRSNFTKPVLSLPSREFSVCVRFSPVKYKLRPVLRESNKNEKTSDETKPWEKYETLFCLPYRMVYAIATQNTILFYDTQQAEPFSKISKIHYIGLNDIAWSADGLSLVVGSTDGFCSIVNFKGSDLGQTYEKEQGQKTKTENLRDKKSDEIEVNGKEDSLDIKKIKSVEEDKKPSLKCIQPITISSDSSKPAAEQEEKKKRVPFITLS